MKYFFRHCPSSLFEQSRSRASLLSLTFVGLLGCSTGCSERDPESDGAATGGATTGGSATGGATSGGAATGGAATGGAATGGAATGGAATGGAATGGAATGGAATGGAATGGAATGGAATGGTGGDGTGGAGTGGGGQQSTGHRTCDGSPFPGVTLTPIMSEGNAAVYVTSPPNDASRIFVVDLTGTLRIVEDGNVVTAGSFAVENGFGEQGFHSIAFHPNFDGDNENRIYLAYNEPGGDTRVVETTLTGDTLDTTDLEGKTIIEQTQPDQNHNGGQVLFGPDGYLYFGFGDGGASCDAGHGTGFLGLTSMPDNRAADLTSALGSILRIDVDNPGTFPAGNIAAEGGNDGRILHWGVRNPWRFSFDRATADLYIADVGQNAYEELNVLPAAANGSPGPSTDFGWPAMEGLHDSSASMCNAAPEPDPSAMEPIHEYGRSDGASITGGYVYRGSAIPEMQGRYIFADYESDLIWTITWDGSEACDFADISDTFDPNGMLNGITSFGEDANGELYVAVANMGGTTVYRVDPE